MAFYLIGDSAKKSQPGVYVHVYATLFARRWSAAIKYREARGRRGEGISRSIRTGARRPPSRVRTVWIRNETLLRRNRRKENAGASEKALITCFLVPCPRVKDVPADKLGKQGTSADECLNLLSSQFQLDYMLQFSHKLELSKRYQFVIPQRPEVFLQSYLFL